MIYYIGDIHGSTYELTKFCYKESIYNGAISLANQMHQQTATDCRVPGKSADASRGIWCGNP